MCEPTKEEIKEIEAEILKERGREVEWSNRWDCVDKEEKGYLEHIGGQIKNQGQI